jgi:transposase
LRCLDCGYVANADFVGSVNVGLKFIVDTFYNGNALSGEAHNLSQVPSPVLNESEGLEFGLS